MRQFFEFLWNGGLDPATADPGLVRERRTIAGTTMLLMPVALILILANTIFFDASIENLPIFVGMVILSAALYLQAAFGWSRLAAQLLISVFWFAPTAIMLSQGLNTSNWAFLVVLSILALLLGGRRAGIIWTVVAVVTMWVFVGLTLAGYMEVGVRPDRHAIAVGISGPLLVVMLCIAGVAFRGSQMQAESKLRKNVSRLAEEVETRRAAEEAALAAERSKAVFLTTMSHELRTPLNGVIGAGQLLRNTQLNDDQRELLEVVTNSGEILLDLINDVLDISKMEAGRLELESRPVQVVALVESSLAPLLIAGREKGVAVDFTVADNVPDWVLGDPMRLRQILLNLCGNALKFTDSGRVHVTVAKVGEDVQFEVKDTGIGIALEAQDNLFQPFTQADSSTARRFGGTGLGLTIVKQLVDLMGGEISLSSSPGAGTTFTLCVPLLACEEARPMVTSVDEPRQAPRQLKVLVTDDNAVNRMVAAKMLARLNHEVLEAGDGVEALAVIAREPVDLVLMDVQMPQMDGLTATRNIRAMTAPLCDLPVVGLSANALDSDKVDMLAAGMDESLAKPVRIEQLREVLTRLTQDEPRAAH